MDVYLSGCMICKHLQKRPEERVEAPEAGITHMVSQLMWVLGTEF